MAIIRAATVGRACKANVKQFCADVKPGKGAIADCMKSHVAGIQRRPQGSVGEGRSGQQVASQAAVWAGRSQWTNRPCRRSQEGSVTNSKGWPEEPPLVGRRAGDRFVATIPTCSRGSK